MINRLLVSPLKQVFRFFSSLKTAIPLLVLTIIVTVGGSLLPTPDFFRTWWYLGLLGLNGVSLLFITILHMPMILERKGRNALIGVVVTHAGILILIAGVIYGGMSGFRHSVRVIEGEMTVVPGLPFVIHLDRLVVEEYPPESVAHLDPNVVPKKKQDSHLTLYRDGQPVHKAVVAPGMPAKLDGITILPAFDELGWYFELIAPDSRGQDKVVPVRPWAPPLIRVGKIQVMAHALTGDGQLTAQVFTIADGQMVPLGIVSKDQPLDIDGRSIALGDYKRYTSLEIYKRPHEPILVAGCLAMLFGLVWHFYFRHREQKPARKRKTPNV